MVLHSCIIANMTCIILYRLQLFLPIHVVKLLSTKYKKYSIANFRINEYLCMKKSILFQTTFFNFREFPIFCVV